MVENDEKLEGGEHIDSPLHIEDTMRDVPPEEVEPLEKRLELFNASLIALQEKHNIRIGAEVYLIDGQIKAKAVALDLKK